MEKEITGVHTLLMIKPRPEESSKGSFGCLGMLCGSEYMTGAAVLCAYGALRSGVGLLRAIGTDEVIKRLQSVLAEPVFTPLDINEIPKINAFVCGCGIGRNYDNILGDYLQKITVPSVLDADCINFLSAHKDVLRKIGCEFLLTPHPAEASRLTGKSVADIQQCREETALSIAREYNCTVLLKGHGTVIASANGRVCINTSGSSALAKGGSGDVLSGVIGSLAAQGYPLFDAAVLGAYIHGLAAENLSETLGKSGVLPSDLPAEIGRIMG